MSRSSRRASRSLIAVVAVAIVLGTFFTIHKLHSSHAEVAKAPAAEPVNSAPAPAPVVEAAAPKLVVKAVAPPTTAPAKPVLAEIDPGALVTQTPTGGTQAASTSGGNFDATSTSTPPTTRPGETNSALAPNGSGLAANAQARGELPDLAKRPAADFATPVTDTASHDVTSARPASIPDAKARADSGDLLASRQLLNDALISGRLGDSDADATKKQIDEINKTVIFSAKKFPDDTWGGTYQVASGERMASIAARNGTSWELLSRVNGVTPKKMRSGQYIKIFKGPFYAVVYKHLFKMEIYLGAPGGPGSMYVTSYPVGLGKDNSTPTGLWMCKAGDKIRNPRYYPSRGGEIIAPDDPKNPLGGYWIAIEGLEGQALGKESYGIHGTIDPDSIGKMESQGCIRLKSEDISWVFDLLVDGKSKVMIRD